MKRLPYLPLILGLVLATAPAQADPKPNILLVLTDDLGFSDLGCYGSEIDTPNLDRLAAKGLRFTQFYNTAKCHSSRVSLLSGRWCRQAGDESLSRAVTLPEVLAPTGYFTAMSGKWHLQKEPTDFGFQRFFGHLSGACSYYRGDQTFRLNGEPWKVPAKGFYTTVAKVDHALTFLDEARQAAQPWFLYLAFNAPHAPLQPLEADYKKYLGRYDVGWDAVRTARLAKQKQLGLFGKEIEPAERPASIPAWDQLTPEIRDWEARRMAAYAGMIDRVDQELGRLLANLEAAGEMENTLILFFSDNGACPYDRVSTGMDQQPYDGVTSWSDSTGWAWARNAPFRYYKQNQFEGGIATPAIVHWPKGLKTPPGALNHSPAHLVDVLPTLAEIAGAPVPEVYPGRELTPLAGLSLKPLLEGKQITARPPIHFLFNTDRALRDGDWKIVSFQSEPWELYHLAEDRTERNDLAASQPNRLRRMVDHWHSMTAEVLQAPAKERAPVAATASGQVHREWSVYTGQRGAITSSRGEAGTTKRKSASATKSAGIRPRIGTKLQIQGDELVLECTGSDPGLAIDAVKRLPSAGPYLLSFAVQSSASGVADVYFTTDSITKLPAGERVAFEVVHDGDWRDVTVELETDKRLHALRLDPCGGPGVVRLRDLKLLDSMGKVLQKWPQ